MDERIAKLEALLFLHGEPIVAKKIAQLLGIKPEDVGSLIEEYTKSLEGRGLTVVSEGDRYQLVTRSEYRELLEEFMKDELKGDLSPATVETLSIILYLGPIPRSRIDFLRGVNSSFIIRNLLLRGLIDRMPDPARANQFLYSATFELLRHLGLESREKLPEFADLRERLERIQKGQDESGADPASST